jgi:hypothetical protein
MSLLAFPLRTHETRFSAHRFQTSVIGSLSLVSDGKVLLVGNNVNVYDS